MLRDEGAEMATAQLAVEQPPTDAWDGLWRTRKRSNHHHSDFTVSMENVYILLRRDWMLFFRHRPELDCDKSRCYSDCNWSVFFLSVCRYEGLKNCVSLSGYQYYILTVDFFTIFYTMTCHWTCLWRTLFNGLRTMTRNKVV